MTAIAAAKIDPVIARLRQRLGERCTTGQAVREAHGRDESFHAAHAPDVVVFPESTEEVQEIVGICAETQTPVIPFGTGTSLEGHVAALHGGVCIDLTRMKRVIAVNAADLDCTVEAGVT